MNTKNKKIWIFLFTIPCMILFALVYAAPIITVFYTSLCDYTAFSAPAFQGIKNFITIFSDSDFICSIVFGFICYSLRLWFRNASANACWPPCRM